jgi:sortase (surface protein transpeptidase)
LDEKGLMPGNNETDKIMKQMNQVSAQQQQQQQQQSTERKPAMAFLQIPIVKTYLVPLD